MTLNKDVSQIAFFLCRARLKNKRQFSKRLNTRFLPTLPICYISFVQCNVRTRLHRKNNAPVSGDGKVTLIYIFGDMIDHWPLAWRRSTCSCWCPVCPTLPSTLRSLQKKTKGQFREMVFLTILSRPTYNICTTRNIIVAQFYIWRNQRLALLVWRSCAQYTSSTNFLFLQQFQPF
jgi:hypothetical protein